jgi:predicted cupin superfamily sugar epimerase
MIEQPFTTQELIAQLNLQKNPEGGERNRLHEAITDRCLIGYYVETDRQVQEIPSPFAGECLIIIPYRFSDNESSRTS